MIAPPRPCTPRDTSSMSEDGAKPHTREAPAKSAMPAIKTARRPRRSAALPPRRRKPAKIRV